MKMNIKELGCKVVQWIDLAQDSDQCFSLVNMASNMCFQKVLSACVVHMIFTPSSEGFLQFFGGIYCFLFQGGQIWFRSMLK